MEISSYPLRSRSGRSLMVLATLALFTSSLPSEASRRKRPVVGKASYHPTYSGMTTAARGVRMDSILRVRDPRTGKVIFVKVKDACGAPMKNMNRVLDLSPTSFKALYGKNSLGRGVQPVSYTVHRVGKGRFIPHFR